MSQHYRDPEREDDKWSLPDVEVFYIGVSDFLHADDSTWMFERMTELHNEDGPYDSDDDSDTAAKQHAADLAGWYYWFCLPGCLPDSDAIGPFKTQDEALADARENG